MNVPRRQVIQIHHQGTMTNVILCQYIEKVLRYFTIISENFNLLVMLHQDSSSGHEHHDCPPVAIHSIIVEKLKFQHVGEGKVWESPKSVQQFHLIPYHLISLDKSGRLTNTIHRATLLAWQIISCRVEAKSPWEVLNLTISFLLPVVYFSTVISGFHFLHKLKKMHTAFSNHPSGLLSILPTPGEMGALVFFSCSSRP